MEHLKDEIINGMICKFTKASNGYVEGNCGRYIVGSYKTKKGTIKELKKMMRK